MGERRFSGAKDFFWFRKGSRENEEIAVAIQEYLHDPDPKDSQTESIYSYMIQTKSGVRIERDVHHNGLFPVSKWISLLDEAGFKAERISLPGNEGGYGGNMFIGALTTD